MRLKIHAKYVLLIVLVIIRTVLLKRHLHVYMCNVWLCILYQSTTELHPSIIILMVVVARARTLDPHLLSRREVCERLQAETGVSC